MTILDIKCRCPGRTRELQLTEELDRATALIMGLQSENEAALERERTTRHQAAAESHFAQEKQLHISRLSAANQVLQDRLRVIENRCQELDKVNTTCKVCFPSDYTSY